MVPKDKRNPILLVCDLRLVFEKVKSDVRRGSLSKIWLAALILPQQF